MSAKIRAELLWAIKVVLATALFLPLVIIVIAVILLVLKIVNLLLPVVFIATFAIVIPLIIMSLKPRQCKCGGGWMRRTWVKEGNYEWRLRYVCTICGDVRVTALTFGGDV